DLRGRLAILRVHTKCVPMDDDVDLEIMARGTPGFVGADLQNLVNEAALLAAKQDGSRVEMKHFEGAKDKVILGTERRSLVMSEEDKRMTAYHEGGHALVAMMNKDSDPVHKVTIIPRGMALGLTLTMPTEDQYSLSKNQLAARIEHAMGGRAAEKLIFGELSTGASNDLKQATGLARSMVCDYGMSEQLGPVYYGNDGNDVFLGRDWTSHKEMSEKTAEQIDAEIKVMLDAGYAEALRILTEKREVLDCIAEALLERETLNREDLALLLEGKPLPPVPPVSEVEPTRESEVGEKSAQKPVEVDEVFPGNKIPDPLPS
ncbi:MAG: cell division protein FtsH, partial [Deltaproteobacteria bacterium]|nr:cell division protein FtsH [Deltaproteobacteria bacterium]